MGSVSVAQSHRSLKVWHLAIDLVKQLHLLSSDIRAHRGVSTALLGGDLFFEPITKRYARNVQLHLASIFHDQSSLLETSQVVIDSLSLIFVDLGL